MHALGITVERGADLLGDSVFDRLDSYVVVRPRGVSSSPDGEEFRTPTQLDKGPNPEIHAFGMLEYRDEEGLEFYVYSEDLQSNELVGVGFLPKAQFLTEAFRGEVSLAGAFSGKGASKAAGHIFLDVKHVRSLCMAVLSRGTRWRPYQTRSWSTGNLRSTFLILVFCSRE